VAVLMRTRWDSPAEAAEWQDAYAQAAQRRYGEGLTPLAAPADQRLWRTPDGALLLSGDGADTVLVVAPTAEKALNLALSGAESPLSLGPAAGGPALSFRAAELGVP
jgi:photosystem II stability/assembly factor-like uncharacterized protein